MTGSTYDDRASAAALLQELVEDPAGDVATSIYDTARLVSLTPWLPGHAARLEFLLGAQGADGGWGEPDGYALVPTLSVTEALLTCLHRPATADGIDVARLVRATNGGLAALRRWSDSHAAIPDTIAVEVVVPALVAAINAHLDAPEPSPDAVFRLAVPDGMDAGAPAALAARLEPARIVPQTWWASLEVLGRAAVRTDRIQPCDGVVAGSPAATAAWLGHPEQATPATAAALRYLDALQARGGGPVPGVTPITFFEQAWVLSSLADAALGSAVAPDILDSLDAALGPAGAPAAPGLPPDCDDGAVVLTALHRYGRDRSPECLLGYRTAGYFRCFTAERTPSTSTNAHALEALERAIAAHPDQRPRLGPVAAATAEWLLDAQHPDGCWWDKWHASPYYATVCCVQALAMRPDEPSRRALARAVEWVLATQNDSGSWGRWGGTVEETAYGIQILAHGRIGAGRDVRKPVAAGAAFLREQPESAPHKGLWHAKDLYAPRRVIRAARLAALASAKTLALTADGVPSRPPAAAAARRLPARRSAPTRLVQAGSGSTPRRR